MRQQGHRLTISNGAIASAGVELGTTTGDSRTFSGAGSDTAGDTGIFGGDLMKDSQGEVVGVSGGVQGGGIGVETFSTQTVSYGLHDLVSDIRNDIDSAIDLFRGEE